MRENISEHITFEEATASSTAEQNSIDNTPTDEIIEVMKATAKAVFEPVRIFFGCRIAVTSFFRSEKVNSFLEKNPTVLASKKSQHTKGEAMDINGNVFGGVTNKQIFDYILANLEFDQLIWESADDDPEPEWIHVSYKSDKDAVNRKEVLRRIRVDGKFKYERI